MLAWPRRPRGPADYVLVATAKNITINCETRYSVVFNGTTPGPALYMKENHATWVRVYNKIPDQNLTVHWHGLSQRASPFSDGTPAVSQWPIAPGEFFDYAITPEIGDAGTYFYHSHVGFQASTAQGVIVVQDLEAIPYEYDQDVPLLIQDYFDKNDSTIQQGLVANPFRWSGEPYSIQINGFSGNSSFSNANGQYTMPWTTDHVQLGSGQRFSVLLKTKSRADLQKSNQTSYWIRYENRDRPTNVSGYALLQYNISGSDRPDQLPASPPLTLPRDVINWAEYAFEALRPAEVFPRLSEVTRTIYITMRQVIRVGSYTNGTINGTLQWEQDNLIWQTEQRESNNSLPYLVQVYLTGQTPNYTAALENGGWDPYSNAFPALPGEVLDIVWLSNSGPTGGWDFHPLHAHGKHYFDLGSGNGTYNATTNEAKFHRYTPARRDTTILYRYIFLRRRPPMMLLSSFIGVASTAMLFLSPAFAVDKTVDPQLVARLKTMATMKDRLDLLSDNQLLYNFTANPMYSWTPGSVANANAATWPVLSTVRMTVAQLNLGPCAMLAPHIHRATNLVVALYSFLDDNDPGTVNLAQSFFMMPQEIGMQVMPFINLTNGSWNSTAQSIPAIGTGSQDGFDACRRKCGLTGGSQY
ncbi:L-ascorbate oxidase, partial [Aureobasidium melanogenum]